MEAWDVIVIGNGPAALRSAATSAKHGAKTLLMSSTSLGAYGLTANEGISAPILEMNNRGHREDTIKSGFFMCDQDIVAQKTSMAIDEMNHLEKAGMVFSRDAKGLPRPQKGIGHGSPRIVGAGDASSREVQQILEEQCMKYGVVRRADQLPLKLAQTKQKVDGVVVLDMINGQLLAIQAKAIIIADGGFEGVFNGTGISLGIDLALRAGLPLRGMEFIAKTPLGVANSKLIISSAILGYGANLCDVSGEQLTADTLSDLCDKIDDSGAAVLDAREMGDGKKWWQSVFRKVKSATGVDMNKFTIGLENRVCQTIGGIPTDEHGRAIIGSWSRWFTGLYAAGDAACSGLNGAGVLPGNRLLDSITSGSSAGAHAAEWIKEHSFANTESLVKSLADCEANLAKTIESEQSEAVYRIGPINEKLMSIANRFVNGPNSAEDLSDYILELQDLSSIAKSLHLDQASLIANTNYLMIKNVQAGIRLLMCSVRASLARNETRGVHKRTDFAESNNELIHHITVDFDGNIGALALRKGKKGNWILAP